MVKIPVNWASLTFPISLMRQPPETKQKCTFKLSTPINMIPQAVHIASTKNSFNKLVFVLTTQMTGIMFSSRRNTT